MKPWTRLAALAAPLLGAIGRAYADEPGGAAGEDPVGAAVRELWTRIGSPAGFLRRISWMNDFEDLQRALTDP